MALIPRRVTPRMVAANRLNKLKPGDARSLGAAEEGKIKQSFFVTRNRQALENTGGGAKTNSLWGQNELATNCPRSRNHGE